MKSYSAIVKFKNREFRFDFENCVLEFISVEGGSVEVLDAIGVSNEDWLYNQEFVLEMYNADLDEEMAYLLEFEL